MRNLSPARCAAALLIVATAVASPFAFTASAGPSKGDPLAAKKLYTTKCVACHKADGSGGVKLTGNPTPSWKDAKRMATVTDDQLRDCITNGRPKSGMVAWGKNGQLKPADIENMIAYIRTISKK
ncbi:MAG: cytochrome c [Candidatus Eisenbacteria bacterium]|uniref:Cytochrome c n=1 Tax=Eiseniibacteriota bacterium TaxID=2212470 RepID=A0A849SUB8_UNCEI|nr:cytochrome c [Candidatus Eisenbacteria bacterium]